MKYADFLNAVDDSTRAVCQRVYVENKDTIKIKKEETAVKNLEKILDAVFEITYEKGFQAMSMRDLSRRSGLSMGAMYPYFRSKEELLTIILRQGRTMLNTVFEKFRTAPGGPFEKLETVIRAHIYLSERARSWFYFMFMEARNLSAGERKAILESEAYTEAALVEILEEGESAGAFQKRDHMLTASIIKAMQQEWYLKRWKYSKRGVTVDDYADYVVDFVKTFCMAQNLNKEAN